MSRSKGALVRQKIEYKHQVLRSCWASFLRFDTMFLGSARGHLEVTLDRAKALRSGSVGHLVAYQLKSKGRKGSGWEREARKEKWVARKDK